RATAALASLRGSGRLDGEAERVVANAALQIDDLAPLGRALEVPLAGSLQLDADADGPLLRPEGRLRLAATDLAAAEVAVAELQTTLDLAMLDRLDRRGAMVQVVAEGTARALRLPGEVALPPQDVAWQGELRAPVDRVGTATLERLAVSAGHLRLAAEGTFDASTLGGEARLELALDALAPLAEAYGQAITGSAALEGNLELSADAEVVSIDLYGRASELGGLPQGVGELIGAA